MIKFSTIFEESFDSLEQQKLQFRTQLRDTLAKEGGLQDGELGPEALRLVDRWMEDPRSLLDADDIEFIIDDETLFDDDDSYLMEM